MIPEPHIIERENKRPILMDIRGPRGGETVIFCHGYKGYKDWGCWNLMADYLADHSICVVKFNFSGNGGTMDDPVDFPDLKAFSENNYTQEVNDLKDVIDAVEQEFQFSKLTLVGHSRAGGIVSIVASHDERVNKLITLASVSDYSTRFPSGPYFNDWKEKGVFYVKNARTDQEMPHLFQFFEDFEKNRDFLNIEVALNHLEIPHLILHGSKDEAVNVNEAFNLQKWSGNSSLNIIEGTGHTFETKHPWTEDSLPEIFTDVLELMVDFMVEE